MTRSGLIFDDRYRLDERIAAGGVGQVWRAHDLLLSRPVAVKVLRPEYAEHPETLDRFRKEARHAGSLNHPNIAQVYDYGHDQAAGSPYLVMELVDGPALADMLDIEPVEPGFALDVIAQVAEGLSAAHRAGLVHRDIKPGNILIGADGRVKVTDFGIAHAAGQAPVTSPGLVMGTIQYLAPERITGTSGSGASDLYALGIVLHECLTGVPPFDGNPADIMAAHLYRSLPPLPSGVPPEINVLIARLTVKDPGKRINDARDLAAQAALLRDALAAGGLVPAARGGLYAAELPLLPDAATVAPVVVPPPAPASSALANQALANQTLANQALADSTLSSSALFNSAPSGSVGAGSGWADLGWSDFGQGSGHRTVPPGTSPPTNPADNQRGAGLGTPNAADGTAARHRRRRAGAYAAGAVLLAGASLAGLLVSGALRSAPAADRLTVRSSSTGTPTLGPTPSGTGSGATARTSPGGAIGPSGATRSATTRASATRPAPRPGVTPAGGAPAASPSAHPSTGPTTGPTTGASTGASHPPRQSASPSAPASSAPPRNSGSPSGTPSPSPTPPPTDTASPTPSSPASSSPPPICILGICL